MVYYYSLVNDESEGSIELLFHNFQRFKIFLNIGRSAAEDVRYFFTFHQLINVVILENLVETIHYGRDGTYFRM